MKKFLFLAVLFQVSNLVWSQQPLPTYFQWDTAHQRFPVTNLNFNTDTGLVQFAILSDRTGGMNPGIFEDAVDKANLLQPQFILSVGDLINGYSTDQELINGQWKEFNSILEPLTVPFFYVPGNHDISNAWMQEEWKRRFGPSHYYFIYKDVLFLCINSQDEGDYGMKDAQVNYFLSILKKYNKVKWTFVFMHQPLWARQQTGFEKIEAALADRDYTVFAGHTHNYLLSERNKRKYFILATSGGGSERRGAKFGEFDHITWVTLQQKDPKVVHLELSGIIKEDIVDERIKKAIRPLTSGSWLQVQPAMAASASVKDLSATIQLKNSGNLPLKVSGELPTGEAFQSNPGFIELVLPPGGEEIINYTITGKNETLLNLATLPPVEVSLKAAHTIDSTVYELPATKRVLINWPNSIEKITKPVAVNTVFDTVSFTKLVYPEYVAEAWDWQGNTDAAIWFKVQQDQQYLYISTIITDDAFIIQQGEHRDKALLYLEDKAGKATVITVFPDQPATKPQATFLDGTPIKLKYTSQSTLMDKRWQQQLKIPLKELLQPDGKIRFNIGYADQDDKNSLECATIYWKPLWGSGVDYKGSGSFY